MPIAIYIIDKISECDRLMDKKAVNWGYWSLCSFKRCQA